jgi:hypothetical protein
MSKRQYLKQIKSLEVRIDEHKNKIETEKNKTTPDAGLIKFWEKEMEGYQKGLLKAMKRLQRGR